MVRSSFVVAALLVASAAPTLAENGPTLATVVVDQAPLRGAPWADSKLFPQKLTKGQRLLVTGREGDYLKVPTRAFVHGDYVSGDRIANCSFLNVRASRNGQVVKVLTVGARVRLTGNKNGDWLEIDTVAFVDRSHVESSETETETDIVTDLESDLLLEATELHHDLAPLPLEEEDGLPMLQLPSAIEAEEESDETPAQQPLVLTETDLSLSLEEAEELLKELEADPEGMWEQHQENFADREEFDAAIVECREICGQLRSQTDSRGIAGTYELSRSRIGSNPKVVLEIEATDLTDHYRVTRTRTHKDEVVLNSGGVGTWSAKKGKLEVEWDRSSGVAQVLRNGDDQGDDGAGSTAADYRIQASTGEIKGDFASPEEGWAREKGWRQGSIQPLEGVYELQPTWYAFGHKPVTTLTVGAPTGDGTCPVTREVEGETQHGLGRIDGRKVKVDFPELDISYEVEENGKIGGTWRVHRGSRRNNQTGDFRAERGWRQDVPQDEIPGMLKRSFGALKGLFSSKKSETPARHVNDER